MLVSYILFKPNNYENVRYLRLNGKKNSLELHVKLEFYRFEFQKYISKLCYWATAKKYFTNSDTLLNIYFTNSDILLNIISNCAIGPLLKNISQTVTYC